MTTLFNQDGYALLVTERDGQTYFVAFAGERDFLRTLMAEWCAASIHGHCQIVPAVITPDGIASSRTAATHDALRAELEAEERR